MKKNYQKLKQAFANDPDMLKLLESQEQTELMQQIADTAKQQQEDARRVKIEFLRGEDGHTPIMGEDYMTPEEIDAIRKSVTPIKGVHYDDGYTPVKGKDYNDGIDGISPDPKAIAREVQKNIKIPTAEEVAAQIPQSIVNKDEIVQQIMAMIPAAPPLTIQQVVEEIRKGKLLDISDIKNWQSARKANGNFDMNDQRWHGGGGEGGGLWTPLGVTTSTVGGIMAGTDLGLIPITIESTLIAMLYPPNSPTVVLNSIPAGGLRETGDDVTTVDLTPTTTMGTLPIISLTITGTDGFNYSYPSPNPAGGVEATQTDPTGFATNNSYTAVVSDGMYSGSSTVTFSFAPVYYYGSANQALSIAVDGGGLTKLLIGNTASMSQIFNPVFPQVYYFAYPSAYPALTSILDTNGFETISDWTVTTLNVTNSFGSVINYRQYEFKNPTTTVNFTNTFIQ